MTSEDGDVVQALFASERTAMRRLAYVICGDLGEADDIVQDAFLQLHRRIASVQQPGAYLRTAVINGCRSRLRRRSTERRWVAPRPDVSTQAHDEISDVLARLGDRQRIALVMRYYLDSSDEEIAETLSARPATVRSLLRRGLGQMRKELGENDA